MTSELSTALRLRGRAVVQLVFRTLLATTPRLPHLVVSGFPATEGNAVEMVRAASRRYPGRIFWLVPDVAIAAEVLDAIGLDGATNIDIVSNRSAKAVLCTATAEVIMFTHGVFGNPAPVRRKTMVNLWHGGGFKGSIMVTKDGKPSVRSDFLIGSTKLIGPILAEQSMVSPEHLLVLGNPRTAQFARTRPEHLTRLGIDPGKPFVVWMPTFRKNRGHGLREAWAEVQGDRGQLNATAAEGARILVDHGITVVVKPHPQDADSRAIEGALIVTNDDLARAGVQLYELLGGAAGLLTDYSSVWIDYLALDRPIGFVVPDREAYTAGRGFDPPDALDWLPGPRVLDPADFAEFARDVNEGGQRTRQLRLDAVEHWGHVHFPDGPDRILDELAARGVFRQPLLEPARAEEHDGS